MCVAQVAKTEAPKGIEGGEYIMFFTYSVKNTSDLDESQKSMFWCEKGGYPWFRRRLASLTNFI